MPDRNQPLTETPYSDEELEHFRKKLVQEQINTNEEIEGLKESYEGIVSNEDDTKSSIDHHHGNIGTEEEIKERNLILIERYNKKIELINAALEDRKSTRLNSSHVAISYAVFCLKKKR